MKKLIFILTFLVAIPLYLSAQSDQLTSKCALNAGENTIYLKDFVVELPQATTKADLPVYKANFTLMKNMNYRFTLCDQDNSKGDLVISVFEGEKLVASSFIEKTGKLYSSIDLMCNKTGLYQLRFSFKDGQQGVGVGIVSLIK